MRFVVAGATWWTTLDAPRLIGTVSDAHGPVTVEARILGQLVATTTVAGTSWDLALPAGSIAATGSTVVIRAIDAPGNATADAAATSPFLREPLIREVPPALLATVRAVAYGHDTEQEVRVPPFVIEGGYGPPGDWHLRVRLQDTW